MTGSTASPTAGRRHLVLPVVIAVSLAVVTAALLLMPGQQEEAPTGATSTSQAQQPQAQGQASGQATSDPLARLARRTAGDPMSLGKVDAPVVMIAYSEFQCPFCGRFARETEPTLVKDYVDTGVLRIEWRDFPYLGPESWTAAAAGRAAAAQGRFWQFQSAMYHAQQPPNSGRLTKDYLAGIAQRIGLDVSRFRTDMDSPALSEAVQRDFQEGQAIGVTGTPAFLVNGRPIIGAQPTAEFVKAIEQARASAP